jgi:hypothetical protein
MPDPLRVIHSVGMTNSSGRQLVGFLSTFDRPPVVQVRYDCGSQHVKSDERHEYRAMQVGWQDM